MALGCVLSRLCACVSVCVYLLHSFEGPCYQLTTHLPSTATLCLAEVASISNDPLNPTSSGSGDVWGGPLANGDYAFGLVGACGGPWSATVCVWRSSLGCWSAAACVPGEGGGGGSTTFRMPQWWLRPQLSTAWLLHLSLGPTSEVPWVALGECTVGRLPLPLVLAHGAYLPFASVWRLPAHAHSPVPQCQPAHS